MSERARPSVRLRMASGFYRFRESLFLLPALLVAMGVALALVARTIDEAVSTGRRVPLTLDMSSNAAAWLLSTVAGATITTASVVFSLTVVSLQLASSQFSPRVMRSFIRDRVSQVVIGMLVATFVYCVLTLPNVSGEATDPAPPVSLTVAVVLTVITVVVIMAHLDHLARRLQVGHVVRDIASEGEQVIRDMVKSDARQRPADDTMPPAPADSMVVAAAADGWVDQIAVEQLFAAVPPGTKLQLETRVGAYIHQGEPLLAVWPRPTDTGKAARRLAAAVGVGDSRTMQQDVDFALRQLVDIGLRALSAAINRCAVAGASHAHLPCRGGGPSRARTCPAASDRAVAAELGNRAWTASRRPRPAAGHGRQQHRSR